jgi:hypothetical protein
LLKFCEPVLRRRTSDACSRRTKGRRTLETSGEGPYKWERK